MEAFKGGINNAVVDIILLLDELVEHLDWAWLFKDYRSTNPGLTLDKTYGANPGLALIGL